MTMHTDCANIFVFLEIHEHGRAIEKMGFYPLMRP